jgi:hypothetical protein
VEGDPLRPLFPYGVFDRYYWLSKCRRIENCNGRSEEPLQRTGGGIRNGKCTKAIAGYLLYTGVTPVSLSWPR